jgi:RNA polymerase sigma-54 factor
MTPQLQQAIKLLQLSTLDLQQEIQQALESNIMLEVDEENTSNPQGLELQLENFAINNEINTPAAIDSEAKALDELSLDTSWENVYEEAIASAAGYAEEFDFETQHSKVQTLQEHLLLLLLMQLTKKAI